MALLTVCVCALTCPFCLSYPYYMLKIFDIEVEAVTWLRYSLWMVLYPLGFLCEGEWWSINTRALRNGRRFFNTLAIVSLQSIHGHTFPGIVIFKNIIYFEETKRFSYHLPNMLNWSFDLPSIMRTYLLFISFPRKWRESGALNLTVRSFNLHPFIQLIVPYSCLSSFSCIVLYVLMSNMYRQRSLNLGKKKPLKQKKKTS